MLDKERVLLKIDELKGYLDELRQIAPKSFSEYRGSIEKRRACERLLHLSVECVLDVCGLIVSGLMLGLPSSEEDLLGKVGEARIVSPKTLSKLRGMGPSEISWFTGTGT